MEIEIQITLEGFAAKGYGEGWENAQNNLVQLGIVTPDFDMQCDILDEEGFSKWLVDNLRTNNIESLTFTSSFNFGDNFQSFKQALTETLSLKTLNVTSYSGDNTLLYEGIVSNKSVTTLNAILDRAVHASGTYQDWKQLSFALAHNKSIQRLIIQEVSYEGIHRPIAFDEDATDNFFKFLKTNNVITEIETHVTRSTKEVLDLAEGLKHNTSVSHITFAGNPPVFGRHNNQPPRDLGAFDDYLKLTKTLPNISLSSINVTSASLERFLAALSANGSSASLDLCSIDIVEGAPDPLIHFLRTTQNLHKFRLKYYFNANETAPAEDIILGLSENKSITDLALHRLTVTTSSAFTGLIRNNKIIKKLSILGRLPQFISEEVEKALTLNDTLTHLHYGTALAYLKILEHNTTLSSIKVIDMPANDLIELLKTNTNLTEIIVDGFYVYDEQAIEAISSALENNFVLTNVSIYGVSNCREISQRNYILKKQRYEDTVVIIYNVVRSDLFNQLPIDVWFVIFDYVRYPGLKSFDSLVKSVIKLHRKQ